MLPVIRTRTRVLPSSRSPVRPPPTRSPRRDGRGGCATEHHRTPHDRPRRLASRRGHPGQHECHRATRLFWYSRARPAQPFDQHPIVQCRGLPVRASGAGWLGGPVHQRHHVNDRQLVYLRRQQHRRLVLRRQPDRQPAASSGDERPAGVRHRGDARHVHDAEPRQSFGLGLISFTVDASAASGVVPVSIIPFDINTAPNGTLISDNQGGSIPFTTSDGTITIQAANVVPEPSTFMLTIVGAGGSILLSLVLRRRDRRRHHTRRNVAVPAPHRRFTL